jgi:hypothetical protein
MQAHMFIEGCRWVHSAPPMLVHHHQRMARVGSLGPQSEYGGALWALIVVRLDCNLFPSLAMPFPALRSITIDWLMMPPCCTSCEFDQGAEQF